MLVCFFSSTHASIDLTRKNSKKKNVMYPLQKTEISMYVFTLCERDQRKWIIDKVWTPHFGSCVSHSMASSIFTWKFDLLIKNDLESPLIFVLFLKGKQNNIIICKPMAHAQPLYLGFLIGTRVNLLSLLVVVNTHKFFHVL